MWVEDKSTHTFHGGFELEHLALLRRKGKQREQNYRCAVITLFLLACLVSMLFLRHKQHCDDQEQVL